MGRSFMRADGDFRQDAIIKTEIYKNEIEPSFEILFCIDDRKQVVDESSWSYMFARQMEIS